jgi:hypothetical protein
MSTTSPIPDLLHQILAHPTGGVTGLVDDLLAVCRQTGLQLDWHADRCRVRPLAIDGAGLTEVPLPKSVFRAILARVAVLCNERRPNSVSPYGGQGELSAGSNPATLFKVTFANTADEQRLELLPVGQACR